MRRAVGAALDLGAAEHGIKTVRVALDPTAPAMQRHTNHDSLCRSEYRLGSRLARPAICRLAALDECAGMAGQLDPTRPADYLVAGEAHRYCDLACRFRRSC